MEKHVLSPGGFWLQ
jgi:hypothetical protein